MSNSTITIQAGKLARVSPDFHITRGLSESHTLTLLNSSGTALNTTGVFSWGLHVAEDFRTSTDILTATSTITATQNVLAVTLNAHTAELKSYLEGKKTSPAFATLAGFAGNGDIAMLITFPLTCLNAVYNAESEPLPIEPSEYYTKLQTDALLADIAHTLEVPTDINQLDDADGLLFDGDYNSLQNIPAIPADVSDLTDSGGLIPADLTDLTDTTGILSGKVDVVAGKELSDNNYSDTDLAKVAKINLETLATLSGTDVSVAPWTQSKWSASGTCTLTASGWAVAGHQIAYILITLAAEATLSVSGATVADDDALSAAGTYACYLINENGTVRFKVAGFTEAA
jgi:hypothetical protein